MAILGNVVHQLLILLRRPEAPPQLLLGAARPPRHATRPQAMGYSAANESCQLERPSREDDDDDTMS